MEPNNEHAFYAWLIVIGAVCIVTIVGALIDRILLTRRLKDLRSERSLSKHVK